MGKVNGFEQFNEARRNRNKGGKNQRRSVASTGFGSHLAHDFRTNPMSISVSSNKIGMPMAYSERFKYIINKIASKNNVIAKELLRLPSLTGETFQYSYLDIMSAESVSYLYYTDRGVLVDDKYKSPKRQSSKIYKIIKSIFGSRFTKTDVTKFVSLYKAIYTQGPDKKDFPNTELSNEQISNKLIIDTINDKLKWVKQHNATDMTKYYAYVKITENKGIAFELLRFYGRYEGNSTIIVALMNKLGKNDEEKRKWVKTIKFNELTEFFKKFVEKYEKHNL